VARATPAVKAQNGQAARAGSTGRQHGQAARAGLILSPKGRGNNNGQK